jgi:hypothetical protein
MRHDDPVVFVKQRVWEQIVFRNSRGIRVNTEEVYE